MYFRPFIGVMDFTPMYKAAGCISCSVKVTSFTDVSDDHGSRSRGGQIFRMETGKPPWGKVESEL